MVGLAAARSLETASFNDAEASASRPTGLLVSRFSVMEKKGGRVE